MKKAVLVLVVSMVSTIAFAQQRIDLMAGSSVRISVNQETTVTCGGEGAAVGSKCSIGVGNFSEYYVTTANGKVLRHGLSFDGAIAVAKQLQSAGLCN